MSEPETPPASSLAARAKEIARKAGRWLKDKDLLPRGTSRRSIRGSLPKHWLHWLSVVALVAIVFGYSLSWFKGNRPMLMDPLLQNDDARTGVFEFHRWGPEHALKDDPIANEMMSYVTPFVRLQYFIFVPLTNLYVAVKLIQALALVILLYAGWTALRARRGGLAVAALLVFFMMHTPYVLNRVAGGFPRSFAFPCFALWIAGAIAGSDRARWLGVLIGSAAYPSAGGMLVAAEGVYVMRDGFRLTRALFGRLKRYAVLLGLCACVLIPSMPSNEAGPLHTLEQAEKDPAFGPQGRLPQVPLANPESEFINHLLEPLRATKPPQIPTQAARARSYVFLGPLLVFMGLLLIAALRWSAVPHAAWAFFVGTVAVYTISIVFAFKLYAPERYYHYGTLTTTVALAATTLGLLKPRARWKNMSVGQRIQLRATIRNVAACAMIAFTLWITGSGIVEKNGMTIEGRTNADLYAFIKTLPLDVRIASHPMDGDDVPLWTGRAMMGGYETLQPWLVEGWKKASARCEDELRAMYATSPDVVFAYADKYKVTHFLIKPNRYGADYVARSRMFEPLGSFAASLAGAAQQNQLMFAKIPPEAVVFKNGNFTLVEVAKLRAAWKR